AVTLPLTLVFWHPADTEALYPASVAITSASTLIGLGIGLVMERHIVRFDAGGPWRDRIRRFVLGMLIVGVLYVAPYLLVSLELPYAVQALVQFLRYGAVGWAVAFFCPWLFVRLGLAGREPEAQQVPAADPTMAN
ncbi:MAG TPA: hypothetical protein VLC52_08390, partial [Anaerolineae bacterium]|nr:hypothetical protein [Anaerolineae bacterium]